MSEQRLAERMPCTVTRIVADPPVIADVARVIARSAGRPAFSEADVLASLDETDRGATELARFGRKLRAELDVSDAVLIALNDWLTVIPDLLEAGPTPADASPDAAQPTLLARVQYVVARLLGYAVGYASLQNGRILNNVVPKRTTGTSVDVNDGSGAFALHCEDAIHDRRPDWVTLGCLRNPDATPTLLSAIGDVRLDDETWVLLREPAYTQVANRAQGGSALRQQRPQPLVGGPPERPTLRVNTCAMTSAECRSDRHWRAYLALRDELDRAITSIALRPGDLLIFDNHRLAHGREGFTARYDGTDRWLHRIIVRRSIADFADECVPGSPNVLRRNVELREFVPEHVGAR